jgi:MazG nucleotide pyrophosphohydrolase domain.
MRLRLSINKGDCAMNQKDLLNDINEKTSLNQIQEYIKTVVELRGFVNQPIQETMLLLLEETGELAKAIRKTATKMSVDVEKMQNYDTIESEVADVFFSIDGCMQSAKYKSS